MSFDHIPVGWRCGPVRYSLNNIHDKVSTLKASRLFQTVPTKLSNDFSAIFAECPMGLSSYYAISNRLSLIILVLISLSNIVKPSGVVSLNGLTKIKGVCIDKSLFLQMLITTFMCRQCADVQRVIQAMIFYSV